jgi:hypothetical protein
MVFTLEAVKAKEGDSLILHFGPKSAPKLVVIDGGPSGVWKSFLRPRLDEIKQKLSPNDPLPLQAIGVSHIDADHIVGIQALTSELVRAKAKQEDGLVAPKDLWHNGLDQLLDEELDIAEVASLADAFDRGEMVVASVGQGNDLDADAVTLGLKVNRRFGAGPIVTGDKTKIGDIEFLAVAPAEERLRKLRDDWKKKSPQELLDAHEAEVLKIDDTVYNLSSVVLLVRCPEGTMLLTGDALDDHIMEGLKALGHLHDGGTFDVDVLKMPHHGSDYNVHPKFFATVRARHYVISGDGKNGNPETQTLEWLRDARKGEKYDVWLTYETGKKGLGPKLKAWEATLDDKVTVHYPKAGRSSLVLNLGDEIAW